MKSIEKSPPPLHFSGSGGILVDRNRLEKVENIVTKRRGGGGVNFLQTSLIKYDLSFLGG